MKIDDVQFVMKLGYILPKNFFKVIYFHQIQKFCTVFNATGYSICTVCNETRLPSFITNCTEHKVSSQTVQNYFKVIYFHPKLLAFEICTSNFDQVCSRQHGLIRACISDSLFRLILTHLCLMVFPTLIIWTNPFPF